MNRLHQWYCQSNRWRRKLNSEILPWALNGVDLGEKVLELGPGPGLMTEWLVRHCRHVTCLELDAMAAHSLSRRTAKDKVKVAAGDAAEMPFANGLFSSVLSFTMLHHLPSAALQDRLFCEAFRVLKSGGIFVGCDSMWSLGMQLFHVSDTMVAINPERLPARLEAAGFAAVNIKTRGRRFRFLGRRQGLRLPIGL
jgi:SAM-dependent methyltransferase